MVSFDSEKLEGEADSVNSSNNVNICTQKNGTPLFPAIRTRAPGPCRRACCTAAARCCVQTAPARGMRQHPRPGHPRAASLAGAPGARRACTRAGRKGQGRRGRGLEVMGMKIFTGIRSLFLSLSLPTPTHTTSPTWSAGRECPCCAAPAQPPPRGCRHRGCAAGCSTATTGRAPPTSAAGQTRGSPFPNLERKGERRGERENNKMNRKVKVRACVGN